MRHTWYADSWRQNINIDVDPFVLITVQRPKKRQRAVFATFYSAYLQEERATYGNSIGMLRACRTPPSGLVRTHPLIQQRGLRLLISHLRVANAAIGTINNIDTFPSQDPKGFVSWDTCVCC